MKWKEIREHFPQSWLLLEATEAHSEDNHRILDELAVIEAFPSGESAMDFWSR